MADEGKAKTMTVAVFVTALVLWAAFGALLVTGRGTLDGIWTWFADLPVAARVLVGIIFFPWVAGLWILRASWAPALRYALIAGLAVANLIVFNPWKRSS